MESNNGVCEEAFEVHEWVSELTISMQKEEILVALNYRIDVPCVVQWGMLWFSAPSRLNQRLDGNGTKMHEIPLGYTSGNHSHPQCSFSWIQHTTCVHAEIGGCGSGQSTRQRLGRGHWLETD